MGGKLKSDEFQINGFKTKVTHPAIKEEFVKMRKDGHSVMHSLYNSIINFVNSDENLK